MALARYIRGNIGVHEALLLLRRRLGVSQSAVIFEVLIPQYLYSAYECGDEIPDEHAERLATYFSRSLGLAPDTSLDALVNYVATTLQPHEALLLARKRLGLSQTEVGFDTRVAQFRISAHEGGTALDSESAQALTRYYLSALNLLTGSEG